jgi:hypothetical protein
VRYEVLTNSVKAYGIQVDTVNQYSDYVEGYGGGEKRWARERKLAYDWETESCKTAKIDSWYLGESDRWIRTKTTNRCK